MNEYEYSYRKMFKKSPTFTKDLDKGEKVTIKSSDIVFKKGFKPKFIIYHKLGR